MTTYIMNDLESTVLKRSQYLAANLIELQVLGKLYGIKSAGNENYKINWVDNLVAFIPHPVRIWNLGFIHNESKYCLADVLDGGDLFCAVNTFNAPSVIEKAIIGRLIEMGAHWREEQWWLANDDYNLKLMEVFKMLKPNEIDYLGKIWSIYCIKHFASETQFLLSKYWHQQKPNKSIQ